ncbi:MAG: hypothetical protein L0206_18145 [Actinobacteria bacterium]|nr:hypothetical protein [Actinomycetota bacterium]
MTTKDEREVPWADWVGGLASGRPHKLREPTIAARWDREEAREGDEVKLVVEAPKVPPGTPAVLTIFERDADGKHDLVETLKATVEGEKVERTWTYRYVEDLDDVAYPGDEEKGFHAPELFFEASIRDRKAASGILRFQEDVSFVLLDEAGKPLADRPYEVVLPDGKKLAGRTDAQGKALAKGVPPGPVRIRYPEESWRQVL